MEAFYKKTALKTKNVNLSVDHVEYLNSLENGSDYLRWILDNDEGFKKFIKRGKKCQS